MESLLTFTYLAFFLGLSLHLVGGMLGDSFLGDVSPPPHDHQARHTFQGFGQDIKLVCILDHGEGIQFNLSLFSSFREGCGGELPPTVNT